MKGSVLEGVIYQNLDFHTFHRISGISAYGKYQIQIAECKHYPENLDRLVWTNKESLKLQNITLEGELVKTHIRLK